MDHLRGQIKKLKSQNRQLKRRNRELEKKAHFYEDIIDEVSEDVEMNFCPSCEKGTLSILDFKYVKFETCNNCDYKIKYK